MSTPAIRVDDLCKLYKIGARQSGSYRTLRETVTDAASAPFRRLFSRNSHSSSSSLNASTPQRLSGATSLWALKDVSFEVQPGEVVGIIGRNGAGKSTLLKILSRITEPTNGRVQVRGRIGSLLEVGTGFHPELTGRENTFLNGAILGMTRREIQRKFDEIVAFAEIEEFLDTPVKRYSSGMYVRLAFAVAAHLQPEILVVDEVLAVGDIAFQRKCVGRMAEVSRSGRTVLFVSHNMGAIETLCSWAVLLEHGEVNCTGRVDDVIRTYHQRLYSGNGTPSVGLLDAEIERREQRVFRSASLLDDVGDPTNYVPLGECFHLRIILETPSSLDEPIVGIGIDNTLGQRLLTVQTPLTNSPIQRIVRQCQIDCRIPHFPLAPGDYWVKLALAAKSHQVDVVERALTFSVADGEAFGEGRGFHRGLCLARAQWTISEG